MIYLYWTNNNKMGIQDMYNVIKEAAPESIQKIHLHDISGHRVAIDISIFLYKFIRTAGDIEWKNQFCLLLITLKKHRIRPICIFDGTVQPVEKLGEQQKRRELLGYAQARLNSATKLLQLLESDYKKPIGTPLPKIPDELIAECKKCIAKGPKEDLTNYYHVDDICKALSDIIVKLERQTMPITSNHREQAIELVKAFGLTYFVAPSEAETLCCYFNVKGIVSFVLSEDTDCLAYGADLIAFKDFKISDEQVYYISNSNLCANLGLNLSEFRDLCILLGCDYNERIKGFPPDGKNRKSAVSIGAKGALAMIQEYRSFEGMINAAAVEDVGPSNYKRCRELLTIPEVDDICDKMRIPLNTKLREKRLEQIIKRDGLYISLEKIKELWKPTKIV